MSLWQEIQSLERVFLDQVHCLYLDDSLPMEVRQYLASWIEEQNWSHAANGDLSQAYCLFHTMQTMLDEQLGRLELDNDNNNIVLKHNLHRSKLQLQAKYQDHPEKLANVIDNLLKQERSIVLAASAASQAVVESPSDASMASIQRHNIEGRLVEMQQTVQALKTSIDQLELLQDTFDFRFKTQKILENTAGNSNGHQSQREQELQILLNNLNVYRKEVLARIQELLGRSDTLRDLLLEELGAWKDRQRRACIGDTCDTRLGQLEIWFTAHAEDLFHLLQFLHTLVELHEKMTYQGDPFKVQLPQLLKRLQEQIVVLLKSAFVVEQQPQMPYPTRRPLVLKTSQKFSIRVRLLVKLLDRNHSTKVTIEIDRDAANLGGFRRFNIMTSNTKMLTTDKPQGEELICDFRHIVRVSLERTKKMLKEQKACGSGKGKGGKGINEGMLSILEELHIITLTLDYCYQGLQCQLQTSTLPVVIVSNVNQMSSAWASILWFIMLSKDPMNQQFFSNPPVATWGQLSTVLSWQFAAATEQGLNREQLKMLGEKLCGSAVTASSTITWSQFSKEPTTAGHPRFWTWIDGIILLIQEHLLELWKSGLIMGFVSRKREKHLLKKKKGGTFLLRFSESTPNGAITFTWVEYDNHGSPKFSSVEPYTKEELKLLSLPDILRDYHILAAENIPENPLQYLYPDTARDDAFGPHCSEPQKDLTEQRKYLKRRLIRVSLPTQSEGALVPEAPEVPIPETNVPEQPAEVQTPQMDGLLPENDIPLPNYVHDLDQGFGGLMFERQDPFLSPPDEEQQLAQVLFEMPQELHGLQQLNLNEEDFLH